MELNTIQPADGAKHYKRRVGRGIGSGLGKTAGRGHKVRNRVRAAFIKSVSKAVRCLCNVVCLSAVSNRCATFKAEVRLSDLNNLPVGDVDILV
jgi:large subunit ribosomal protein L15